VLRQVGSSSRGSWTDKNSSVHPQLLDSLLEAARGGRRTGRAGRARSVMSRASTDTSTSGEIHFATWIQTGNATSCRMVV